MVRHSDPLMNAFESICDEREGSPKNPLQLICQAFLNEENRRIAMDDNEPHALVCMPPELCRSF